MELSKRSIVGPVKVALYTLPYTLPSKLAMSVPGVILRLIEPPDVSVEPKVNFLF